MEHDIAGGGGMGFDRLSNVGGGAGGGFCPETPAGSGTPEAGLPGSAAGDIFKNAIKSAPGSVSGLLALWAATETGCGGPLPVEPGFST